MKRRPKVTFPQVLDRLSLMSPECRIQRLVSVWLAAGFLAGSLVGRSLPVKPEYVLTPGAAICALAFLQPTLIGIVGTGFSTGVLSTLFPLLKYSNNPHEKMYGTFEGRVQNVKPGFFHKRRATVDVKRFWGGEEAKVDFRAYLGFDGFDIPSEGEWIRFTSNLKMARTENADRHYYVGSIARRGWIRSRGKDPASKMRDKVTLAVEASEGDQSSAFDGLLRSIAMGDRSQLSRDISTAMKKTGTYHLLAISGVHLGSAFLLGMLLTRPLAALLSGALRPKRFFFVLMAGGWLSCSFYLLITGFSPSATRAAIFVGTVAAGSIGFRESDLLNTLAWSFLLIGVFSSKPQPGISLALSILACLGIWAAVISGKRGLSGWFEACMAAYLFTLPLVTMVFRGIPILAPVWNFLIGIPFVVIIIPLAVAGDVVSVFWRTGALLIFKLWNFLAHPIASFLQWAGKLKWSYMLLNLPGCLLASLLSVLCLFLWWRWSENLKRRVLLLLIPPIMGLLGHWTVDIINRQQVQLSFPGLGKADAIIVRADGMTVMIDSGPPGRVSEEPPIIKSLSKKGIRRIDALFLTHPHPDHVGGTGHVMRNWKVQSLVLPHTSGDLFLWREVLLEVPPGVPVHFVLPGNELRIGNMIFRVMGSDQRAYQPGKDVNRMSMLLHMRWHDLDILFTGDAPWS
ncbi:MBL fold metallo-hydrolase, partial [bacterium]